MLLEFLMREEKGTRIIEIVEIKIWIPRIRIAVWITVWIAIRTVIGTISITD